MTNNTISDNSASNDGGGICVSTNGTVTLTGNTISDSRTTGSSKTAGVHIQGGGSGSVLQENTITDTGTPS